MSKGDVTVVVNDQQQKPYNRRVLGPNLEKVSSHMARLEDGLRA